MYVGKNNAFWKTETKGFHPELQKENGSNEMRQNTKIY